jgi:very-short-patch-repair endonuclease
MVAWETDHERDFWMKANALELLRLSWRQVILEPEHTAAKLRVILDRMTRRR